MKKRPRVLAAASGGGHWIELLRLQPAFDDCDVAYVSMFDNYSAMIPGTRYYTVPDASRFDKFAFIPVLIKSLFIMIRERPGIIVTTGSAPMLCFLLWGKLMGARTLWIDSMAQAEEMSSSGRVAKKLATRVVCQWPNVAADEAVDYWGAVL